MKDFFSTRPLSVLVSFVVCALGALGGSIALIQLRAAWRETAEILGVPQASLAPSAGLSLVAVAIPLISMAALYRDSRLGLRVMAYGTGFLTIVSLAMNVVPLNCLLDAGLIAWMAHELDGVNVFAWAEARLRRPSADDESVSSEP